MTRKRKRGWLFLLGLLGILALAPAVLVLATPREVPLRYLWRHDCIHYHCWSGPDVHAAALPGGGVCIADEMGHITLLDPGGKAVLASSDKGVNSIDEAWSKQTFAELPGSYKAIQPLDANHFVLLDQSYTRLLCLESQGQLCWNCSLQSWADPDSELGVLLCSDGQGNLLVLCNSGHALWFNQAGKLLRSCDFKGKISAQYNIELACASGTGLAFVQEESWQSGPPGRYRLHCIRADGSEAGTQSLKCGGNFAPRALCADDQGQLYAAFLEGAVQCFSAEGKQLWQVGPYGAPPPFRYAASAVQALPGGGVIALCGNSVLRLSPAGQVQWKKEVGYQATSSGLLGSHLLLEGDQVLSLTLRSEPLDIFRARLWPLGLAEERLLLHSFSLDGKEELRRGVEDHPVLLPGSGSGAEVYLLNYTGRTREYGGHDESNFVKRGMRLRRVKLEP